MSAFRKFESSKLGQFFMAILWVISIPIQLVLFLGIGIYGAITGKDMFR
jgi:FtsH-binding integral membrane protein